MPYRVYYKGYFLVEADDEEEATNSDSESGFYTEQVNIKAEKISEEDAECLITSQFTED